jgi:hypothetical protein
MPMGDPLHFNPSHDLINSINPWGKGESLEKAQIES